MIVELSKEQLYYLKTRLPPEYFFLRKSDNGQIEEGDKSNVEQHIYEDEQNKCIKLIEDLKRTEQFRLLTLKDQAQSYHKYFQKQFMKQEDNIKKMKIEHLQKIGTVIAKFYKEMLGMFIKSKFFANNPEMLKLIDELEKRFKMNFEPHQKKCQEQILKSLQSQLFEESQKQNHLKAKQQPNEAEKKDLHEKLSQLSSSSLRHLAQFLNLKQSGEFILDIDKLDATQFRKIFQFVKKRCDRKRLQKALQRFSKDQNIDQDDYSYQSFLSDSNELQNY